MWFDSGSAPANVRPKYGYGYGYSIGASMSQVDFFLGLINIKAKPNPPRTCHRGLRSNTAVLDNVKHGMRHSPQGYHFFYDPQLMRLRWRRDLLPVALAQVQQTGYLRLIISKEVQEEAKQRSSRSLSDTSSEASCISKRSMISLGSRGNQY